MNAANEPSPTPSPGELIREQMKLRGWTQSDLAKVLGRPLPTINEIIQGKRAVMPEMARALGEAFDVPAEVWMQQEASYRLSLADGDFRPVRRRARLHQMGPLKELQKRGWIKATDDETELEREVLGFFSLESVEDVPSIAAATRRSGLEVDLSPAQTAWCFRVKQLANAVKVGRFDPQRLPACKQDLRKLAAYPTETRKVASVLSEYGIRFVVVEPLPGSKIDGVAMWLDEVSPVIGMSMRFDRMDSFWFTLGHELSHVAHRDALSVDTDLAGQEQTPTAAKSPVERRADLESAAMLIPPEELKSFIARVGPQYSKERIVQFAHRMKIHPAVIVGQLQNRGEIGFHALRDMLVKVRQTVVSSSVTDGWGQILDIGGRT